MPSNFQASQFIATDHSTKEDKAKFANQFVKFVEGGFKEQDFPKWFYTRLSMTFGHIAHYNQGGFYGTFFTTIEKQIRFLDMTMRYPCFGLPEYTYSDVERAIQEWLRGTDILELLQAQSEREADEAERKLYERLKSKFE